MMTMQDPNPIPWGAQDKYQAHFIVKRDTSTAFMDFVAKTSLKTKGHFGSKMIVTASWSGSGKLAQLLNEDLELNEMIKKQTIKNATIYIEPTDDMVRIRSKWDNHLDFGITKDMFEIYDRIASHIKAV